MSSIPKIFVLEYNRSQSMTDFKNIHSNKCRYENNIIFIKKASEDRHEWLHS